MPGSDAPDSQSATEDGDSAVAGSQRRMRQMLLGNYRLIWRLLRGLGVPRVALDDAVVEVFTVAKDRCRSQVSAEQRVFLVRTAASVASRARRPGGRQPAGGSWWPDSSSDPPPAPGQVVSGRHAREALVEVLDALAPELRVVFLLFELEGFSLEQTAALLELPAQTVAARLARGRDAFLARAEAVEARLRAAGAQT